MAPNNLQQTRTEEEKKKEQSKSKKRQLTMEGEQAQQQQGEPGKQDQPQSVTAAVVGATGLVGSFLLTRLLEDARYSRVIVPTRRPLSVEGHGDKMMNVVQEDVVAALPKVEKVDHVYVCIGTTRKKTPDPDKYKEIDVGIPDRTSKWAEDVGASYVGVVSSMGANPKSRFRYTRLKGEMEQLVLAKNVPNVSIVQPSIILGTRNESRMGESMARGVMGFFGPVLPRNYRGIHASTIAARLHHDAFAQLGKRTVLSGDIPVPKSKSNNDGGANQ